jgi:hypothetical protein
MVIFTVLVVEGIQLLHLQDPKGGAPGLQFAQSLHISLSRNLAQASQTFLQPSVEI